MSVRIHAVIQSAFLTLRRRSTLPPELGNLSHAAGGALKELHVQANYFTSPLTHIVMRGTGAVLRYLRELQ